MFIKVANQLMFMFISVDNKLMSVFVKVGNQLMFMFIKLGKQLMFMFMKMGIQLMFMFIMVGNHFYEIFCCFCKIERGFMFRILVFWGVTLGTQASVFIVRGGRFQE